MAKKTIIAKKTNSIKHLLATASAVAVFTTGATSAWGTTATTSGGNYILDSVGGNAAANAGNGAGQFANTNSLKYQHQVSGTDDPLSAQDIVIDSVDTNGVDLTNKAYTVHNKNLKLGSVFNSQPNVNAATALFHIIIDAARTVTLDGAIGIAPTINNYTALGNIKFEDANAQLTVNLTNNDVNGKKEITLSGTITANTANDGKIEIAGGNKVTFGGVIGDGRAIGSIKLAGAGSKAVFNANVTVNGGINLHDASAEVTIGNGVTVTGKIDATNGANEGDIKFNQGATVTGTIGENNLVRSVTIGDAAGGTVNLQGAVKSQVINIKNDSTLQFGGAAGALAVEVASGILNTSGVDGSGNIDVNVGANALTVEGNIGSNAANGKLNTINFTGDGTLLSKGAGIWVSEFTQNKGFGVGNARGALSIYGAAGAGNGGFALVGSTSTQGGDYYLTGIKVNANADNTAATKVSMSGNIKLSTEVELVAGKASTWKMEDGSSLTGDFKFRDPNQVLEFGDNTNLTGKIYADNNGDGKIKVSGDATVNHAALKASIGTTVGPARINEIDFATASTLTVNNNGHASEIATANGIKFSADGTLKLAGDQNHTINSAVIAGMAGNPAPESGRGTIIVDNSVGQAGARTVTFNGAIGDVAVGSTNAIKKLDLQSAQNNNPLTVSFAAGDVHLKELHVAGAGTVLKLSSNDSIYIFEKVDTDSEAKGILEVDGDVEVKSINFASQPGDPLGRQSRFASIRFTGDNELLLEDGSTLIATTFDNDAARANKGVLLFDGDAVFSAAPGVNRIKAIRVLDTGKLVRYDSDINIAESLFIAPGSTFDFRGQTLSSDQSVVSLDGAAEGQGILKLNNSTDSQTIDADIAGNVDVVFAGGNVDFTGTSAAHAYKFDNTAAIVVDLGDGNINTADFSVTPDNVTENVVKFDNQDRALRGSLGGQKQIKFISGGNVTVLGDSAKTRKAVFATSDARSELTLAHAGATAAENAAEIGGIASEDGVRFAKVNVNKHYIVNGDAHADVFAVAQGDSLTLKGGLFANDVTLLDRSVVNFESDVVLDNTITNVSANTGRGRVNFGNVNVEINNTLGSAAKKLSAVEFNSDSESKVTQLGADIYADTISFKKQTVDIKSDMTLDGDVTFAGSSLNLAKGTLTADGGDITFSDRTKLYTEYGGSDAATSGKIVNASGDLSFAAGSSLGITISDVTNQIARDAAEIVIIDNQGNDNTSLAQLIAAGSTTIELGNKNNLVRWVVHEDNGTLKLVRENIAQEVLNKQLKEGLSGNNFAAANDLLGKVLSATVGTDAAKFADSMTTLTKAQQAEAFARVVNAANLSLNQTSSSLASAVSSRMASVLPISTANFAATVAEADLTAIGVAAGDDYDRFGIWGSPLFGTATQKAREGSVGYKLGSFGVTGGFDLKANDDLVLGAALTYSHSDVKHKDVKEGDKTKISSFIGSIYGMQQITSRWFLQGVASMGNSKVDNHSKRVGVNNAHEEAIGKYDSMLLTGEVIAGYNCALEGISLIPMAGARFTRVSDNGYTETGTTNQNLDIKKKASNKFEVVGGLKIAGVYDVNDVRILPEIHGFVNHDLIGKTSSAEITLSGAESFEQKSAKPVRTSFNVGLGLGVAYGNMDYGATYDATLSNKYVGHQGTLKIRVNF